MTAMTLPTMRCVFAAAVLAIAGCASTNVSTIPYPNVGDFPPTDPARVQILRTEPARPHLKLGEITVDATSSPPPTAQEVDGMLRMAAAKLGADAAVVVVDTTQPGLAVASGTWWGRTPMSRAAREVIAVAVKYR
jgi:type IV pilus biogenesis protein CpaD/CtpE